MTTVKVYKTNGLIKKIDVSGHSGYADAGSDIVCSAITSALMLTHISLVDVLNLNIETYVNDKNAEICITVDDIDIKKAQNAFNAFHLHMQNLMLDYSDYIDILEV